MNKIYRIAVATLALGGLAVSPAVSAQALSCDDIEFTSAVTKEFPKVAESCQEVVERDGALYAKFVADVVGVWRNGKITVDIKARDGSSIRQSFHPTSEFRVSVEGKPTRVRDLVRGQQIRIYLPSDRWAVAQVAGPDVPVVVAPLTPPELEPAPQPAPEMVAELPGTASYLPLMGLAGALLVFLGGAFTAMRRLHARK